MKRKYIVLLVSVSALVFLFCDKGDKSDLRTFFPGPGFEKGWSWYGLPELYSGEKIKNDESLKKFGFAENLKEAAKSTYFWGNADDSSFTVYLFKVASDSLSKVFADLLENKKRIPEFEQKKDIKFWFYENKYIVIFETEADSPHIIKAIKIVTEKIKKKIISSSD
ncbi:hypothetical protein DRQ07_08970 [candidate division KSB1 bacterium]|nr:MAG: hypothetical protein DRQ07_08970 [candidate division KSB1 bacterium]